MRERTVGAAANMLFDFEEYNDNYRYLAATNDAEGDTERFAIMSLGNPPAGQPGEAGGVNPAIDDCLWVEGLAAYEFDPEDGGKAHFYPIYSKPPESRLEYIDPLPFQRH